MTLVEAGDLTGYYAEVTRELDKQKRYMAIVFHNLVDCVVLVSMG